MAGLILDSPLGVPTTPAETLDVFEARGGPLAREAAQRFLAGDTSVAAGEAWKQHALPLYGDATAQADMRERRARARMNDAVQTHFRTGNCGPAEGTHLVPSVRCPALILAGQLDPVVPAAATRRFAASFGTAPVACEILPGVGHGTFRQATGQAFAHVRRFLAGLPSAPRGALILVARRAREYTT